MSTIQTPCIKICMLDPGSGLCRGCGRNVEEIASWGRLSEADRTRIMALLPERMRQLGAGDRAHASAP